MQESNKVKTISVQGFEGKLEFPKIEIHVPDDKREMDPSASDWEK